MINTRLAGINVREMCIKQYVGKFYQLQKLSQGQLQYLLFDY